MSAFAGLRPSIKPKAFRIPSGSEIGKRRRGDPDVAGTTAMVFNGGVGKRLLNVREAAQYLGLEVDTVYKKARLREIPSVKVGRALRFDIQALERFVEQHAIETID